ncbi:MAG TPA: membrane protein insertion efficiency factor YidD [Bacilli bacterium]|nr:membrane protein insertion efficiency factor YidD [Bacilli bacterium]
MKKLLIKLIKLYQATPLRVHNYCRHIPTCSEYMIGCLENFGTLKGLFLGTKRVLKCHPFGTYGYDPVPKKEEI